MTHRALLFDIGNTRVKWGIATDGDIRRTGTISHERLREKGWSALTTRLPTSVDAVMASNVAGATFATRLSGVIGMHCHCDVHFAHSAAEGFGVISSYKQPRKLGVDRWVAMIGARAHSRKALCVVDAGTAVTIDALDKTGQHLGGQILPGVRLMNDALAKDTSDLPAIKRAASNKAEILPGFASSTGKAIYNGAMAAVCGAIERAMRNMKSAGLRPALVLTGGDASRILAVLDGAAEHRPHLVLEGLALMIEGKK